MPWPLIAIYAGAVGSGPFSGHNLLAKMVILQAGPPRCPGTGPGTGTAAGR